MLHRSGRKNVDWMPIGIPHWCTVIACAHEGQPVVGVIFDPSTGELFRAARGGGALVPRQRRRGRLARPRRGRRRVRRRGGVGHHARRVPRPRHRLFHQEPANLDHRSCRKWFLRMLNVGKQLHPALISFSQVLQRMDKWIMAQHIENRAEFLCMDFLRGNGLAILLN